MDATRMSGQDFPPRAPLPDSAPMPPRFPITFDDIEASARRALDRLQSTSENISAIRVEHSDDDDRVTVVVDGTGALVDLRIADDAMSMPAAELAQLVVDTATAGAGTAFAELGGHITAFTAAAADDPGPQGLLMRPADGADEPGRGVS
ncbi:YbaB/EbfC family nucleoid-associated protein [Williamsia deligens]|uniref:YbaB/EbfC family nucleoid-associated protein n=1 Tax=Williamsia deligens TaxID=321325 RepID=A0ABW3GB93_9NOCA|nr:YbaB/EbfC family nucleoid-associated protein [Williamsia deligens]MCP2192974.1 YbaB/EbfC DNA-binding family protein [Williamsia deligens]